VVLVAGSGDGDRHEGDDYARTLARHGHTALIYDKRGTGRSAGDPASVRYFSLEALAADAVAGGTFLRTLAAVDGARVGLAGVSQGGWVAPLAARRDPRTAFLILISASVSTVAEDRLFERRARRREGFTNAELAEVHEMQLVDHAVTRIGTGFAAFEALWRRHKDKRWFRRVYLTDEPPAADHPYRLWERTILDFDPQPILSELTMPVGWVFGAARHDPLSPVEASLERVRALRASGRPYHIVAFKASGSATIRPFGVAVARSMP
jgi:hypothetical protein